MFIVEARLLAMVNEASEPTRVIREFLGDDWQVAEVKVNGHPVVMAFVHADKTSLPNLLGISLVGGHEVRGTIVLGDHVITEDNEKRIGHLSKHVADDLLGILADIREEVASWGR